jgi:hypothetical protein
VLFLSARGAEAKTQVWSLSLDGGEGEPMTDEPGGVIRFEPAPDGSLVLVCADPPELRRKPLVGRSELLCETSAPDGELRLSWDGGRALFRGEGDDLYAFDVATHARTRLTRREGTETSPSWSFDGTKIYFLAALDPALPASRTAVFEVSASGGEPSLVTPRLEESAVELHSCRGSDRLFTTVPDGDGTWIARIRPAEKKVEKLVRHEGRIHSLAVREDGERMLFVLEQHEDLPRIASWSFPDEEVTILTAKPRPPAWMTP